MTESAPLHERDPFCPQCGLLSREDDADGCAVSPIDEDGCCRFCGGDTCGLDQLREHLAARGLHVVSAADSAVLDAMGELGTPMLELIRDGYSALPQTLHPPCLAELARREAPHG